MRRKVAQGVVPPVVGQTIVHEVYFIDEVMDRHEFDCGDSQVSQMIDESGVAESGVSAPQMFWNAMMTRCSTFDVCFIDDGVAPGGAEQLIALPVEVPVHHDTAWHIGRRVQMTNLEVVASRVSENCVVETEATTHRSGVGIGEQFCWVPPCTARWIPWPMDPEPVFGASSEARKVAGEDSIGLVRQLDALLGAIREHTEFDGFRSLGPHRRIYATPNEVHAERIPVSGSLDHLGTVSQGLARLLDARTPVYVPGGNR